MQQVLEATIQVIPSTPSVPLATNGVPISQADAERAVRCYVDAHLDPSFSVSADQQANRRAAEQGVWRFFVCCAEGPLSAIEVDRHSGHVSSFSDAEIRLMQEKAAIYLARSQGMSPMDKRGYVLGEYARRRASRYLDDHLSMYYSGTDPLLIPGQPPLWQVTIIFKRHTVGPITLGVMDVNATTGEPIPLSTEEIEHIRERTRAIIRHQT